MKSPICRNASSGSGDLLAFLLVWAIAVTGSVANVYSQGSIESFTGFKRDTDAPINIEADTLDVNDKSKIAVFRGDVRAHQGTFLLRSKELRITYKGDNGGSSMGSEITRIEAKEKVLITSVGEQSASSEWANFDVASNTIEIGGNVILTQGKNVLKCGTMFIDLNTGRSRCNTRDGRVRGIFNPKKTSRPASSKTN